jgi:hypothetical protein
MRDGSEKQVKIDVMLNDLKSSLQLWRPLLASQAQDHL